MDPIDSGDIMKRRKLILRGSNRGTDQNNAAAVRKQFVLANRTRLSRLDSTVSLSECILFFGSISLSVVEEQCEHVHQCCTVTCVFPFEQECQEERCGPPPLPPMDSRGSGTERDVDSALIKSDSLAFYEGCFCFTILALVSLS